MIKYTKMTGYMFLSLIIGTTLVALLSYFNILNGNILAIVKFLIPAVIIFITSFKLGKTAKEKGYITGLLNGMIFIVIVSFLNLVLFKNGFDLGLFLYFLIMLFIAVAGGMLGINKKKLS